MYETGSTAAARPAAHTPRGDETSDLDKRWQALVSQIGAEIAAPLTAALERINALASTGQIDRQGLRSLREEVEAARQAGMIGQQLTRFASGRLRQSYERLQLAEALNGLLAHRARETLARGIRLKTSLKPVEVIVDPSLLSSLLNATLDWALANAQSQIDFTIDIKPWPVHARLACRFTHRPLDPIIDGAGATAPHGLDSLTWRLLEQTAWTMGLEVERNEDTHATTLMFEFRRTPSRELDGGGGGFEINDGFSPSTNSQPLAGSHVLIVSPRRDLRVQIRDALRNMSLIVDFVNSVEEAEGFCREGLPHAILIESAQLGKRFARFHEETLADVPDFVFIEIVEQGSTLETSSVHAGAMARLGREALATSLPAALMFELSKGS